MKPRRVEYIDLIYGSLESVKCKFEERAFEVGVTLRTGDCVPGFEFRSASSRSNGSGQEQEESDDHEMADLSGGSGGEDYTESDDGSEGEDYAESGDFSGDFEMGVDVEGSFMY